MNISVGNLCFLCFFLFNFCFFLCFLFLWFLLSLSFSSDTSDTSRYWCVWEQLWNMEVVMYFFFVIAIFLFTFRIALSLVCFFNFVFILSGLFLLFGLINFRVEFRKLLDVFTLIYRFLGCFHLSFLLFNLLSANSRLPRFLLTWFLLQLWLLFSMLEFLSILKIRHNVFSLSGQFLHQLSLLLTGNLRISLLSVLSLCSYLRSYLLNMLYNLEQFILG